MAFTEDYKRGYKQGMLDKMKGERNDFAWDGDETFSLPENVEYSQGYRDGWTEGKDLS